MYGLIKESHAYDIAHDVVKVLGGDYNVTRLLLEIAQQETQMGQYRDQTHYAAGTGLHQFDELPFYDIIKRTRQKHIDKVLEAYDVDMREVEWRELEHSPLLSFIACRLFWLLNPETVGDTIEKRALQWKKYYNTNLGKGHTSEYIENAKKVCVI